MEPDGRYTAANQLADNHELKATALQGFRLYPQAGIVVTINTITRSNVKPGVGQLTKEEATVTAPLPALRAARGIRRSGSSASGSG